MKFKIIKGDKGNIDFDNPIEMTDEEKLKFIKLVKLLFAPTLVQVEKVNQLRDWRIGGDRVQYPRAWTAEEYEVLLRSHSIEEAMDKLGRSGMAIIVQDGLWRPEFFSWCHKNGKNPFEGETIQIIKEFMKEKHDEILARRNKRKLLRNKKQEINELLEELKNWDTNKKRNQIELLVRLKQIKGMNVNEYIQNKKEGINLKIKQLQKEIDSVNE